MPLRNVTGALLPDSSAEAYVCPVDFVTNRVNLALTNTHTAAVSVRIWIVPASESVGDAYKVIGMESGAAQLQPGETRFYPMNQTLVVGDKIFWEASVDAVVAAKLDLNEVADAGITVDGFTRKYLVNDDNTGFVPDALDAAFTIPATAQLLQAEAVLHSIDTAVAISYELRAVPNGETASADQWIIARGVMYPGEIKILQIEHFLDGQTVIHWEAGTASKIVGRLSFETVEA
jgi:hypothetical protein